jgi:hypothetical protein
MTLTIKIDMDNAAFDPSGTEEEVRILRELADHLEKHGTTRPGWSKSLLDINGNKVGTATVTERAS